MDRKFLNESPVCREVILVLSRSCLLDIKVDKFDHTSDLSKYSMKDEG